MTLLNPKAPELHSIIIIVAGYISTEDFNYSHVFCDYFETTVIKAAMVCSSFLDSWRGFGAGIVSAKSALSMQ